MFGKYIDYEPEMELEVGDLVKCYPYLKAEVLKATIIKVLTNGRYMAHEDRYGVDVVLDSTNISKVYKIVENRKKLMRV